MNENLNMVLIFLAGLVLGTLFFGGLWLTVKRAVTSRMPAFLFFGSFLFRISITVFGFYFISYNNGQRLIICVLGFVAARFIILRLTKSNAEKQILLKKEIGHEA